MNLRDLHYLVTLADHLHFSKAAELCHTSQPTLSIQLKKLEEFLGVQLVERSAKQVLFTAVGREIVERARLILAEAEQIRYIAKAAKDPLTGTLALGAFPTLAPYIFPLIVPAIREALPQLELVLHEEKTNQLIERLHKGELDAALIALPVESPLLANSILFHEEFMLAVPASHPFAHKQAVSLEMLAEETMLLLDDGHCLRDQALAVCSRIGKGESNRYRATSLETLRNMIAAGNGMTLMPELAVQAAQRGVAYVPFEPPAPGRSIALVYRASSGRKELFKRVATVCRGVLGASNHR